MKLLLPLLLLVITLGGCRRPSEAVTVMDHVEDIIETYPDSALTLLNNLDPSRLAGAEEKAHYALLMSMALDKNYIDTTTFEILQPAIDRYLTHGTPDQRLRTLYYQGSIYLNRNDDDNAMICFLKASDITDIKDSLVLARLYIARAILHDKIYDVTSLIEEYLRVGDIYKNAGDFFQAVKYYAKAYNGIIFKEDKQRADSVFRVCNELIAECPEAHKFIIASHIIYVTDFGTRAELLELLKKYEGYQADDEVRNLNIKLQLANGFIAVGEPQKAIAVLKELNLQPDDAGYDSYKAIISEAMEAAGDYQGAFEAIRNFHDLEETGFERLFNRDLLFAERKHKIEVENLKELQKRNNMIWEAGFMIVILIVLSLMLYYRYRLSMAQKAVIREENTKLQLESENLCYEMSQLEDERDRLTHLLDSREQMAQPLRNALTERLDALNSLLAKELTDQDSYAKPYRELIDSARKNRSEFMTKTRDAFSLSHPEFIAHLNACGLTDDEINVACLYAIGLRGKDVGEYLQLKSHYNVSSSIRKKLGISFHDTNLNIYIRTLLNKH